jgi:hypothetical protein
MMKVVKKNKISKRSSNSDSDSDSLNTSSLDIDCINDQISEYPPISKSSFTNKFKVMKRKKPKIDPEMPTL